MMVLPPDHGPALDPQRETLHRSLHLDAQRRQRRWLPPALVASVTVLLYWWLRSQDITADNDPRASAALLVYGFYALGLWVTAILCVLALVGEVRAVLRRKH